MLTSTERVKNNLFAIYDDLNRLKQQCESLEGSHIFLDSRLLKVYEYNGEIECTVLKVNIAQQQVAVNFIDPIQGGKVLETVRLKDVAEPTYQ